MLQARTDKTLAALHKGDLPTVASAADNMFLQSVNGTVCSGCAEPIGRLGTFYSVRIRGGNDRPLRLHPACHDVWIRFTPPPDYQKNSSLART